MLSCCYIAIAIVTYKCVLLSNALAYKNKNTHWTVFVKAQKPIKNLVCIENALLIFIV